jgi:alginate O-acetyltransferase complex protein AlgI
LLFNQVEFLILVAVLLAYLEFVRGHRAQKLILLGASYYFYAYWDWRFLGLILLSTVTDYLVGLGLGRSEAPGRRRLLLGVSLAVNLGLLGFFKYFNFFADSLRPILEQAGLGVANLEIILPVGISFYTFQTLSYTIDVYRRRIDVCRDPADFALFVAFFPQLVAGPIVRASHFLPQLRVQPQRTWANVYDGFRLFTLGMFKKVFLADHLAPFADTTFANAGLFDAGTTWLSVLAYGVQIYCDFSGYSDMAIGTARMLGYDLGENFRHPYLATRPDEFWHRWHISLSTWLRDYLYIPLGGSRRGPVRTHLNLMTTMVLGGLWHGASWTFVTWGGIHGALLSITRLLSGSARPTDRSRSAFGRLAGWAVTFGAVMVSWVFFRAQSFQDAWVILGQMFAPAAGMTWHPPFVLGALGAMALYHVLLAVSEERWSLSNLLSEGRWWGPAVLLTLWWLILVYYPAEFDPFIYFQF